MKKLIAMLLCLVSWVFLGEATYETAEAQKTSNPIETQRISSEANQETTSRIENTQTQLNFSKNIEREGGLVTAEYLKSLSWEEIRDNYKELFSYGDDLYIKDIVLYIDRDEDFDVEKNYLISVNRRIYLEKIDYKTMCDRLQTVINTYNTSNEIQIKMYTENDNQEPNHMHITILSSNNPATYVGEEVEIKWGVIVNEKSKNFGSGEWITTFCIDYEGYGFGTPEYIPEDYIVLINGVSYLDENGNVASSYYKTYKEIKEQNIKIQIDRSKPYMLHVCTSKQDLGWTVPEGVKAKN